MKNPFNTFLLPVERFVGRVQKPLRYILLILSFASLGFLFFPHSIKFTGEKSLLLLWIILWIPLFAKVFSFSLFNRLLPLRKELGILMGVLAVVHGLQYYIPQDSISLLSPEFWYHDGTITFLAAGFIALLITIPLLFTSNIASIKFLGKYWKPLHRTVYVLLIFAILHVVLLDWYKHGRIEWGAFVFLAVYFLFKILEWRKVKFFSL